MKNEQTKINELREFFEREYKAWRDDTRFLACPNHSNNPHFQNIVSRGVEIVPLIFKKLEEEESFIVFTLDYIFPGVMKYEGYTPLSDVIKMWKLVGTLIRNGTLSIEELKDKENKNPTED